MKISLFEKFTNYLKLSLLKNKRLLELLSSFSLFFVYIKIIKIELFVPFYLLFNGDENDIYTGGKLVKMTRFELFLKSFSNFWNFILIFLFILTLLGLFFVIKKNKKGLEIFNILLLLFIIPTLAIGSLRLEFNHFPLLLNFPGLVISIMIFFLNRFLIMNYDNKSSSI